MFNSRRGHNHLRARPDATEDDLIFLREKPRRTRFISTLRTIGAAPVMVPISVNAASKLSGASAPADALARAIDQGCPDSGCWTSDQPRSTGEGRGRDPGPRSDRAMQGKTCIGHCPPALDHRRHDRDRRCSTVLAIFEEAPTRNFSPGAVSIARYWTGSPAAFVREAAIVSGTLLPAPVEVAAPASAGSVRSPRARHVPTFCPGETVSPTARS